VVSVPAHLDRASRQKTVDWLVERLLTATLQSCLGDDELLARAIELSDRYLVGARRHRSAGSPTRAPAGLVSYYSARSASHTSASRARWVLDSVLVHEVAHLTHRTIPAFHRLAGAYRAQGGGVFLAGYGSLSNAAP